VHFARYSEVIEEAARQYDPSHLALYLLALAKAYNRFYTELSILGAADSQQKAVRLRLSEVTAIIIRHGMSLLGIEVPERM
jgi:arginyl-tRNA synthetase